MEDNTAETEIETAAESKGIEKEADFVTEVKEKVDTKEDAAAATQVGGNADTKNDHLVGGKIDRGADLVKSGGINTTELNSSSRPPGKTECSICGLKLGQVLVIF